MSTTLSPSAELSTALAALDEARMMALTATFCASDFAGRQVGTQGHARASAFLRNQFRQAGWDVGIQDFAVPVSVVDLSAPPHLAQCDLDGSMRRVFAHRTEFCEHPRSASAPEITEGPVAARISPASEMQGAWVMLETVPQGSDFTELAEELAAQGVIGVLAPRSANADGYLIKRITAAAPVALPVLSIRADLLPQLVGMRLQARVPLVPRSVRGTNVLAQLAGTDERLSQAPLLVGAHYDAMGDDVGGLRHPGATDNAAAVAVLLELARIIPHLPVPPRRSLLLVAFDAEEVGAHGSHALAHQFKEQGKSPLVLNLDGAACLQEAVWVEAGVHTEQILQALDQAGRWLSIPLVPGNIASDQRQFAREGFAAVGLSVGAAKLHTPADSIEQVQPEALRTAATLLLATLSQLW
jgi:aminopeptidase YwaD